MEHKYDRVKDVASFVEENYDTINQIKIFKSPFGFEEVYYNPDSSAGGQFVYNKYPYELLREAARMGSVEGFFEYLNSACAQVCVDIDNEDFLCFAKDFVEKTADYVTSDKETAYALIMAMREHFEVEK